MSIPQDWSEQADLLCQIMADGAALRDPGTPIHARAMRRALLACAKRGERPDPRGLYVIDAAIHGVLDLSYFSTPVPLRFTNCVFDDQVVADCASISVLRLTDCEFRTRETAVRAVGLAVSGDLVFEGLVASAEGDNSVVNLAAASIGRDLVVRGAQLQSTSGTTLDAGGISVKGSAFFENTTADTQSEGFVVWLNNAKVDGRLVFDAVALNSARGAALVAECMTVGGDVEFLRFAADAGGFYGACVLTGSKIGGTLTMQGARITSKFGTALNADRIEVGGDATFSDGFLARTRGPGECAVRLAGAKIGGKLSCERSRLRAKHGTALDAAQINVTRTAALGNVRASGGVTSVELGSAKIGAHLSFDGARLTTRNGPALAADRIDVGGLASFVNDFLASTKTVDRPAVALGGAKIGGQLDFTGARLNNIRGTTLAADGVAVAADIFLDDLRASSGFPLPVVRLVNARIGGRLDCRAFDVDRCVSKLNLMYTDVATFRLNAQYGGNDSRWLVLDGLSYKGIPSDDMDLDEWIDTLKNRTPAYSPQPWHQLGVAHNGIGHDEDARKILIKQRVDYRDRMLTPQPGQRLSTPSKMMLWCRRLWSRLLEVSTGYGYRSHRAFVLLLAVAVLSVVLTTLVAGRVHVASQPPKQRYVAQLSATNADGAPCSLSEQIGVGLQIGLPLIKTPAGDRCRLDTTSRPGQLLTIISWVLQASAWAFATFAVAGYTGLIRRL